MATGPVKHVVLFKFKEDVSENKIQELIDGYKALPGKIEVMKGFEWGTDMSIEGLSQGFTHCFISTFEDSAGRDAYVPHPEHQKYAQGLLPHLDKILVLDFVPEVAL